MRSPSKIVSLVMLLLCGLLLSPALGADLVLNRFDAAAEASTWGFEWGSATGVSIEFDASKDADNNSLSGALKVVVTYDGAVSNNQKAITRSLWPGMDLTDAGSLEFDLMVDPSSPTRGAGGDFGDLSIGTRDGANWAFGQANLPDLTVGGVWTHLSLSFTAFPNAPHDSVQALTLQNWGGDTLTGTTTMWIDNVVIKSKVAVSSTLVINEFDAASEVAGWWYDVCTPPDPPAQCQPTTTLEWDATTDVLGNPNSGSMKVTVNFDADVWDPSGWNKVLLNRNFPGNPRDARDFDRFYAKVKITPESPKDPGGTHGGFEWVFRNNWGWNPIAGVGLPDSGGGVDANGWYTFEVILGNPTTADPLRDALQALTIQLWGGSWQHLIGTTTFWVDDIRLGRTNACADPANCESCYNLVDDNGNGSTDCADPDCNGILHCLETVCTDFVDNEGDGLMDCADPDCAQSPACHVNAVWADLDGDQDVDLDDYGLLQKCFSGGLQFKAGCGGYDRDHNLQIDSFDISAFVDCFSGPGVPTSNCP